MAAVLAACCGWNPKGALFQPCTCALLDGGTQFIALDLQPHCDRSPEALAQECRQNPSMYYQLDAGCPQLPACVCSTVVAPSSFDCGY